jgi:hypothetical protein
MERLRNSKLASGSPEAELADAVSAMEPIAPSASRRHRVLQSVRDRDGRRRVTGLVLLRPAVAGAVLLAAGAAAAGATVGRGWLARGWSQLVSRPAAVMPVAVAPVRRAPAPPPVPAEVVEPSPVAPEPPSPVVRPPVARVATHARPPRGEDPSALVEAVRALRSEHDPQRAARLLDAYLRAYPRGALAEEALALQIEAAASLKSPRAPAFARQYLRDYPNGRFRAVAEQVQKSLP